jgi:hypothetical protein
LICVSDELEGLSIELLDTGVAELEGSVSLELLSEELDSLKSELYAFLEELDYPVVELDIFLDELDSCRITSEELDSSSVEDGGSPPQETIITNVIIDAA